MADQIAVMQHGRIVEQADTDRLWDAPEHPYTQQLMASLPPDL
jgi:ABC-type dipeptide/oligopeptide/nickel transport system ATPase component